ncbi:MAG: ATP-binding protein [Chloroflexi bacterium]|nr:ATP-binding protein [Chloroflexota bacterium]MCI0575848.1 ATP-binding protein [Chloroflexota bacterium]MCI0646575.1 ATP-binding protein [Chloroflexota bacterium]MCI0726377.1 ATP-binding protein [Chloroflexota bacterium]
MAHLPATSKRQQDVLQTNFADNNAEFPPLAPELQRTLQQIVDDVVERLGCVGAILATLEPGNALPTRAYSVSFAPELLGQLEKQLGVGLVGPKSVVYLDEGKHRDNLSVRAVKLVQQNGAPKRDYYLISDNLYDLFRPVVSKKLSDLAQRLTGIRQVAAVPFLLDGEVVGNLFAASQVEFSRRDTDFLIAFGHQAANAIQSQRHLAETQALERVILALQASITDEVQVLQTVVDAVVQKLGYVGAMVATLERGNALPVRAFAVDFGTELLHYLETRLGISPISPRSVVYLDEGRYKDNLSVRAVTGNNGRPVKFLVSNQLYDLFRPIVNRPLSALAQRLTGIKQVLAVPFFLDDEVVGNLFVATRKPQFLPREIVILTSFGQQAAVGIRNARLYRKAEERRQIAQMFARMAFSAAASVHGLRNNISAFRTFLGLVQMTAHLPLDRRQRVLDSSDEVLGRLNEAADILDNLHKPWEQKPDVPTNVNNCLIWAVRELLPEVKFELPEESFEARDGLRLHRALADNLPLILTLPDMLIEAFRVIIKNGVEALLEHEKGSDIWIESRLGANGAIEVTFRDNGIGIKPENLNKIFEMGWSSKKGQGMGFGLFWTRDYVEGLGGTITVESEWKKGTAFHLTLPPADGSGQTRP